MSQRTIYFSVFILTREACLEIGLNSVNIKDCELQWRDLRAGAEVGGTHWLFKAPPTLSWLLSHFLLIVPGMSQALGRRIFCGIFLFATLSLHCS